MSEAQVDTSAEDAAFLAEMAMDDESTTAVVVQDQTPVVEVKKEEPAAPAAEERKEVIAGYTETEIRDALALLPKLQKSLDTVGGTFGTRLAEQQRALDELKADKAKAIGKLSVTKLDRLSKEFPELAKLLVDDLNDGVAQEPESKADPLQFEQLVNTKVAEVENKFVKMEQAREIRAMEKVHPDWKAIATFTQHSDGSVAWNNPAFAKWAAAQPAETTSRLIKEWDADFLVAQLSKFKEDGKPKVVRNKVIEDAVMPRGAGGRFKAVSPDSEEDAAFRAEMAKR